MAEYVADALVDCGHNTGYNRSPVVPGYYEGSQMWVLGQYLIEELHKLGRTTKTTRRSRDENPSVTARGRMAAGCKVAVTEHSNAGGLGKTDRAVGICMVDDDCGPIDELSRELARRLAAASSEVMGLEDPYQVYERRSGRDRDGDGKKNDDYYGFLYGAHQVGVAAIIIENGFHDHRPTAKWLMDDGNLRRLAKAHAAVIDQFLREHFDKEDTDVLKIPMKPGDKGENVRQLQGILRLAGYYDGEIDGSYGPKTKEAVTKFQKANDLDDDGIAGPKTLEVLLAFEFSVKAQMERRYHRIDEMPDWARATVAKMAKLGLLRGTSDDDLDLSLDMLRIYVTNDRAGLYDLGLKETETDANLGDVGDVIERPVEPPSGDLPI